MPDRAAQSRKPVFDVIRRLLARPLRQDEVDAIDDALDVAMGQTGEPLSGETALPRRIGSEGIALIKAFEGCHKVREDGLVEAYPDPGTGGDPWTIGWGATGECTVHGGQIGPGTTWTRAQCDERLERDLERYAADVARALGEAPRSQAQFDALVSFHYNTGAIARATLTKRHLSGDWNGARAEFARWNRAGGRVMAGLVRRRRAEAQLYRA